LSVPPRKPRNVARKRVDKKLKVMETTVVGRAAAFAHEQ
jgi:hypothetical protein